MYSIVNLMTQVKDFCYINPSTLTGAIDVIVVEQPDGSFTCSPFHVRFGKIGVLRSKEKVVDIEINDKPVDFQMRLGDSGEAYFVQKVVGDDVEDVPRHLVCSPIEIREDCVKQIQGFSADNVQKKDKLDPSGDEDITKVDTQKPKIFHAETSDIQVTKKVSCCNVDFRPIVETQIGSSTLGLELQPAVDPVNIPSVGEVRDENTVIVKPVAQVGKRRDENTVIEKPVAQVGELSDENTVNEKPVAKVGELRDANTVIVKPVAQVGELKDANTVIEKPVAQVCEPTRAKGRRKKSQLKKKKKKKDLQSKSEDESVIDDGSISNVAVLPSGKKGRKVEKEKAIVRRRPFKVDEILQMGPLQETEDTESTGTDHVGCAEREAMMCSNTSMELAGLEPATENDYNFFSDSEANESRHVDLRSDSIQSDSELDKMSTADNEEANRSWRWGELPSPPPQAEKPEVSTSGSSQSGSRRSMLSSMFAFMQHSRKNPDSGANFTDQSRSPGDMYLEELTSSALDPQVAAMYFPPSHLTRFQEAYDSEADDKTSGEGSSSEDNQDVARVGKPDVVPDESACDGEGPAPETVAIEQQAIPDQEANIQEEDVESGFGASVPGSPEAVSGNKSGTESLLCGHHGNSDLTCAQCLTDETKLDLEMSLCGGLNEGGPSEEDFRTHLVSFADYQNNLKVVEDPRLVVRRLGKYYSWSAAAPLVVAAAFYQSQLSHHSLDLLATPCDTSKTKQANTYSSWWSWSKKLAPVTELTSPDEKPTAPGENVTYKKTLRLSSEQIARLDLCSGQNSAVFSVTSAYQGTTVCKCHIYRWRYDDRVVISDIDGTITKSDVLGHLMPMLGRDWAQSGVAQLFNKIQKNGYNLLYVSARAIGQSRTTRSYLQSIRQEDISLPQGPLLLSPTGLLNALHREVIDKRPEDFKIPCLKDILTLFPAGCKPFYAGFGNRVNDVWTYRAVGIPMFRVFTVNHRGELTHESSKTFKTTYYSLSEIGDHMFPSYKRANACEDFSSFLYWRDPIQEVDLVSSPGHS